MGACGCGDDEAEKHKKLEEGAAAPEQQMKAFHDKMKEAGLNDAAIKAFEANYTKLVEGAATTMPEAEIKPAENVTKYEELQVGRASPLKFDSPTHFPHWPVVVTSRIAVGCCRLVVLCGPCKS